MSSTAKMGMVGRKPKVVIKPATEQSALTPEQKAAARLARRIAAAEKGK